MCSCRFPQNFYSPLEFVEDFSLSLSHFVSFTDFSSEEENKLFTLQVPLHFPRYTVCVIESITLRIDSKVLIVNSALRRMRNDHNNFRREIRYIPCIWFSQ